MITENEIKNIILNILSEYFGIDNAELDIDIIDIYGINSIDILYIFHLVEIKLNIPEISKANLKICAIAGGRTVNRIASYMYENITF